MSPEYAMEGTFSVKSDVFSFGVLLLEIVSGRRCTSIYHPDRPLNLIGFVSFSNESFYLTFQQYDSRLLPMVCAMLWQYYVSIKVSLVDQSAPLVCGH